MQVRVLGNDEDGLTIMLNFKDRKERMVAEYLFWANRSVAEAVWRERRSDCLQNKITERELMDASAAIFQKLSEQQPTDEV